MPNCLQLRQRFANRVRRRFRLHACVQHERARAAPEVESRPRAVGVTLALAKVRVDAADELSAEYQIQRDERMVVRRRPRDAEMTNPQLRLRRSGALHHEDTAGRCRGHDWNRRRIGIVDPSRSTPSAERSLREFEQLRVRRVADDDDAGA